MIKVLQVLTSSGVGGAETVALNIGKEINKEQYSVDFFVYEKIDTPYLQKMEEIGAVFSAHFHPKKNVLLFQKQFSTFLLKEKYDVVHFHTNYLSWIGINAAKRAGVKTIVCHSHSASHKGFIPSLFRFFTKISSLNGVVKLACSQAAGKCLFGKNSFLFFHNGIIVDDYRKEIGDFEEVFRKRFGIEGSIVTHVGRFEIMKNHEFMIQLANESLKEDLPFTFVFAGDGPLFEKIRNSCNELVSSKRIVFLGNIDYVSNLLRVSQSFILPSLWEALPVSALEAQCAGIPVLLSDVITKEVVCNHSDVRFLPLIVDRWIEELKKTVGITLDKEQSIVGVEQSGFSIRKEILRIEEIYRSTTQK